MRCCRSKKIVSAASALFMLLSMWGGVCCASPQSAPCNIVLITIDTLRADHLSCNGYERRTSPHIDSLAKKGMVCKNAYAPSSWTLPSMASLFTSVYPINHGVIHGIGLKFDQALYAQEIFSPTLATLAEVLQAHGYTTFAVASHRHLDERFGFARGFNYFTCLPFLSAEKVNEAVCAWEEDMKKAGKYFLWIHYFDPHSPYSPQKPWAREYALQAHTEVMLDLTGQSQADLASLMRSFQNGELPDHLQDLGSEVKKLMQNVNDNVISPEDHSIALYDSEINYVDAHIGDLVKRFNLYDDTLIVITSDHGEEFREHGELMHGHNLYQQTIHIPLVVKLPHSQEGSTVDRFVSLVDVMPTILDIVNISPPPDIPGTSFLNERNLFYWLKGKMAGSAAGYRYSEIDTGRTLRAILSSPWKYIYDCKKETGQLYNIVSDPLEMHDRAGEESGERDRLQDQLLRWMATAKRYPTSKCSEQLSPEEKEKLKGLGYLQ